MTTSPPSGSDAPRADRPSEAFDLLNPKVQRWVWEQGWTALRDAQEAAIRPILSGAIDVLIAAATASGKTEAAFLPICSQLVTNESSQGAGVEVVYLSPLKALINDQFERLDQLCEHLEVSVHRWHGDVASSRKAQVLRDPSGVLLITPESLEAIFVIHGPKLSPLFASLRYVVVDELHSFIGTERGAQLQSLMHRLELALRRRIPRIGLSATLGDLELAAEFLRPGRGESVSVIASTDDSQELKLQLRGYIAAEPQLSAPAAAAAEGAGKEVGVEDLTTGDKLAVTEHLFKALRGTDNLVFANSRREVEVYADLLRRLSERRRIPNEFWPHHGSLSKEIREDVEAALKDRTRPVSAVSTSTLEMGIDIGTVTSIAQIGAPPSVWGLRQRLGRSGRRGDAAVLRIYVSEREVNERTPPPDALRSELVQSIAMVRLLLARWFEPPSPGNLHLSTLVQQILSLIAQHGGVTPREAHGALCGPGPFADVDERRFATLLRNMGSADLVTQASDGTLLHGQTGERIVNHYSFYTAFVTPEEYRLIHEGHPLGTIPIDYPLFEGALVIFGGRRWRVLSVDTRQRVVELTRAKGGRPPTFNGAGIPVDDRIRKEMLAVYKDSDLPAFLDATARDLLAEGRDNFLHYRLDRSSLVSWGGDTLWFPWAGDRTMGTLAVAMAANGLDVSLDGLALTILGTSEADLRGQLEDLASSPPPDPGSLAERAANKAQEKYDWVLSDELLSDVHAARNFDVVEAWRCLQQVSGRNADEDSGAAGFESSSPLPDGTTRNLTSEVRRASRATRASLGSTPFAVIDVETTGFSPRLHDRVIEIAVVRVAPTGGVEDEYVTLVNPERDIGATQVHGISASDVQDAPRFSEIVGDLAARLDGAVLVAHNARFDLSFLASEFARSGTELPTFPCMCTLRMAYVLQPHLASRKLAQCCADLGVVTADSHSALGDAHAAAGLLLALLAQARRSGLLDLEALGCKPLDFPSAGWIATPPSGRSLCRNRAAARHAERQSYLARLVRRLDGHGANDPDIASYLDVLDRVLEDRRITQEEAADLIRTAQEWGLSRTQVFEAHHAYFGSLTHVALADGIITPTERLDLEDVSRHLGLDSAMLDTLLTTPTGEQPPPRMAVGRAESLIGQTVCFTGTLIGRLGGQPLTRARAQELARGAGLVVLDGVTRELNILVVADPNTMSGKAKKARQLGVRIMAEPVFWQAIGVHVE